MSDPVLIAAAAGAGLMLGVLLGMFARRSRPADGQEWKTRLRARDDDLQRAEGRAADAIVELQSVAAELVRARRALEDGGTESDAGTDAQLEELEVELAALHTRLCPDPAAHRSEHPLVPELDGDDLTLVPGLSEKAAALLAASGITTFGGLADLGEEGAVIPDAVAEMLTDRLPGWSSAARHLHTITHGKA